MSFHCSGPHGPKGGPVVLLNGTKERRQRSAEGITVQECGCAHSDWPSMWLQMCTPSHADHFARHEEALLEHATAPEGDWLSL